MKAKKLSYPVLSKTKRFLGTTIFDKVGLRHAFISRVFKTSWRGWWIAYATAYIGAGGLHMQPLTSGLVDCRCNRLHRVWWIAYVTAYIGAGGLHM